MCSHESAIQYWVQALSLNNEHVFPAYKCRNWDDYVKGFCSRNQINYMGIAANPNLCGSFFIRPTFKSVDNSRSSFNSLLKRIKQKTVEIISLDF